MKIANKGIENLKPVTKRSKEEAREISKKGGIRSGEVRRERKKLKEELLLLLSEGDNNRRMSLAIFERALNGDTKAFEVIRDTIGEKPKEEIEVKDVTPKWFKE
nr:MAG TPA: hypothetical protein [Caudoviricetes sp.]